MPRGKAAPKIEPQVPGEAPVAPAQEVTNASAPEGAAPVAEPAPVRKARKEAPAKAVKSVELPDAADINPAAITRSVLTKQGWVTPAEPKR